MGTSLPVVIALINSMIGSVSGAADAVVSTATFDNTTNTLSFTLSNGTTKDIPLDIEERFIGQKSANNTLPNANDLTAFVQATTSPSRAPQIGDVVTWIDIVVGTDEAYKCTYYSSGWAWYKIPPMESASNTDLGLVKGDITTTTNNIRCSISNGIIQSISVKKGDSYIPITDMITSTDLQAVYGQTSSCILQPTDFVGNTKSITISGMNAHDAVFFTPQAVTDRTIAQDSELFVHAEGNTVTFTVTTTPTANITLLYFFARGIQ